MCLYYFNQTCLHEGLLHDYIYIYIYTHTLTHIYGKTGTKSDCRKMYKYKIIWLHHLR